jgi:hypothetical protein
MGLGGPRAIWQGGKQNNPSSSQSLHILSYRKVKIKGWEEEKNK